MNAPSLAAAADDLAVDLRGAGIRAVFDQADLNPPAVLIPAPVIRPRFGKRCWDADWSILAVVPNTGARAALDALAELVGDVVDALDLAVLTAEPVTVSVLPADNALGPLPAYRLTFSTVLD